MGYAASMLSKKLSVLLGRAGATLLNHPSKITYAQFSSQRSEVELGFLDQAFVLEPALWLRTYGHGGLGGVDFLEHLPSVKNVCIEHYPILDWSGLVHLPERIEALALTGSKARIPLGEISRRPSLRRLDLWGSAPPRDYRELAKLEALEQLSLAKAKLDHQACDALGELLFLRKLNLQRCQIDDLAFLGRLPALEQLTLTGCKGLASLADLAPLARSGKLRSLSLAVLPLESLDGIEALTSLERVSIGTIHGVARIDPLAKLKKLSHLSLASMKMLTDLGPLARLKSMTSLHITGCNHLKADDFQPLVGHPALTSIHLGLGSLRKHEAIHALLGI